MEFCSAINKNVIMQFVETLIDLDITILSKVTLT